MRDKRKCEKEGKEKGGKNTWGVAEEKMKQSKY